MQDSHPSVSSSNPDMAPLAGDDVSRTRDLWLEEASAAVVGFSAACVMHELLGHGLACLTAGGSVTRLSSVYFTCAGGVVAADLGGPAGNLVLASVCWLLLRIRPWSYAVRLCLVLALAFNLFWLAGCLIWSGLSGQSDFAYLARLSGHGEFITRSVWVVGGLATGISTIRLLPRLGLSCETARRAYLVAGVASCIAVSFGYGPIGSALREAALEGFGAMAWLLFMPESPSTDHPAPQEPRDSGWPLMTLATVALLALLMLGRGFA